MAIRGSGSGSFKVTTLGTSRKPVCSFSFVNSTNLHPILYCFQDIVAYWSNFSRRLGVPLFNTLVWDEPLNSGMRTVKFGLSKLDTFFYHTLQSIF